MDRPFKDLFGETKTEDGEIFSFSATPSRTKALSSASVPDEMSPVTSLAFSFTSSLRTTTPTSARFERSASFDSACEEVARITDGALSPAPVCALSPAPAPFSDESPRSSKLHNTRGSRRMKTCFRRIKSMKVDLTSPVRELNEKSPSRKILDGNRANLDENSQDSGIGSEKDKADLDDFRFATPVGVAPRRYRQTDENSNSPLRYSPVSNSFSPQCLFPRQRTLSPSCQKVRTNLLKSRSEGDRGASDDDDDGFLELVDIDDNDKLENVPKGLSSLLTAPLMNATSKNANSANKENMTPPQVRGGARAGLFRSPSAPRLGVHLSPTPVGSPFELYSRPLNQNSSKKRPEPYDDHTPLLNKRRRGSVAEEGSAPKPIPKFHRSMSDTETQIKHALSRPDQSELIGDFSRSYCLPTIPGKHSDLRCISRDTLAALMDGQYEYVVEDYLVVDCRYPYEYEGGHIKGARNLYTKDDIIQSLLNKPVTVGDPDKRYIVIFHCEFSSERGPGLSRFLRSQDRLRNNDKYPQLSFPELYLLEGGYKAFYEKYPTYNTPPLYKPMLHKDHAQDLRHFRAKSKSWAGEKSGGGRSGIRGLKF